MVQAALADIEKEFKSWDESSKCVACRTLYTFPYAINAWDLKPIYERAVWKDKDLQVRQRMYMETKIKWTGVISNGAIIDAENTATYNGRVYAVASINYIAFGRMNRVCSNYFSKLSGLNIRGGVGRYSLENSLRIARLYKKGQAATGDYANDPVDVAGIQAFIKAGWLRTGPQGGEVSGQTPRNGSLPFRKWDWVWEPIMPR